MAGKSSETANLACDQCGFLNEPERVYCHNCGAKLDRTLLPKENEKTHEQPATARKRIAKMTNPKSNSLGRELKTFFNVMIYAAITAAVYLISQKPDGVPESKRELGTRLVSSDMMDAVEAPAPVSLSFTEEEINQHLKQSLKAKEGMIPGVKFERAFVKLENGGMRISTEQSLWGYPIFSGIIYRLEIIGGKFSPKVLGGNLGKLAVDPRAMKYGDFFFQKLWAALDRERRQMDKMQSVDVQPGRINFITKGKPR